MKKIYYLLLLLLPEILTAQISVQGTDNGSITITPKGLQGSSNSATGYQSISLGFNALKNNVGSGNIAIGDSSLFTNTTGIFNAALGAFTLQSNTIGRANTAVGYGTLTANETADFNTAIGNIALFRNTSGQRNTAIGNAALVSNTTGVINTAVGNWALFNNTTAGLNTAVGNQALFSNTEGFQNTAVGSFALRSNKTASGNTAVGQSALQNSISNENTAIGHLALRRDSLGAYNTAVGSLTAENLTFGDFNTFLGYAAKTTKDSLINVTAIGANAHVDASNKVRIGDANVTVIEGQVAWSNPSDRRLKENIVYTNRLGLYFINSLKTASYNYIADENKTRYDGFIAQDIEKLVTDLGIPFSGLKKSDDGMLSLAYSDFVMPLVNSIQEQQNVIERLQNEVNVLKRQAQETVELKRRLEQLEAKLLN